MKTALLLVWLFISSIAYTQTDFYREDLSALNDILKKTPSYKAQIKDGKQREYTALYERLNSITPKNDGGLDYFYNLSQLLFPIRDNHLGFYQVVDYSKFRDKESIAAFVNSPEFGQYPTLALDIDSLKAVLKDKPASSVEGIYHYGRFYSVGVFKTKENEYTGVVLDTDINLWKKGQIALQLYETEPGLYKAIYGHALTKSFIYQPIEKYRNNQLVNSQFYGSYWASGYAKFPDRNDFVNLPSEAPLFELRNLGPDTQYLLVRTFQAGKKVADKSSAFYDSIKNSLSAKTLILDLRNNQGGAEKESKKFLRLVKKFAKKGKVYVLQNNGTLSQAEKFILSLKGTRNIVFTGQTTKGMLSYGSNSGKRELLPGKGFQIYITDMKGSPGLLKYEDYGIEPDVTLDNNSEWIEQVLEIIKINEQAAKLEL